MNCEDSPEDSSLLSGTLDSSGGMINFHEEYASGKATASGVSVANADKSCSIVKKVGPGFDCPEPYSDHN